MAKFTDRFAREWLVEIDVESIHQVKLENGGLNIYKLIDDHCQPLGDLVADPPALVGVLNTLCDAQLKERNLSDADFRRAFSGDSLEQAADAFVEALADFFPNQRVRAALKKLSAKGTELRNCIVDRIEAEIDSLDAAAAVDALLAKQRSALSGPVPASSVSTPAV